MEYRSLGRTGLQISNITLGSLFWTEDRTSQYEQWIARAIDAGVNSIDTADIYGKGLSERIIGDVIRRRGGRDRLIIATKTFVQMDDSDPNSGGASRKHIIQACEDSLKRLATDYLDLFYIHRPTTQVPIDETLRALDDLVRSGKVRYIGSSSFPAWKIVESLWAADALKVARFTAEQTPYTLLDRRPERELLPMAHSYGVGVTIWSPLVGGFLAGKYTRGTSAAEAGRLKGERWDESWTQPYMVDRAFDMVDAITAIGARQDRTPAQVALAWTLRNPAVASVVIGPSTTAHLEQSIGLESVDFSADELERIDTICAPGLVLKPFYLDDQFQDFRPDAYSWR